MLIKLCLTFDFLGKILKNLVMKGGTKNAKVNPIPDYCVKFFELDCFFSNDFYKSNFN